MEAIAQNGTAEFYNGSIAQSIVDEVCMYYNSYGPVTKSGRGERGGRKLVIRSSFLLK